MIHVFVGIIIEQEEEQREGDWGQVVVVLVAGRSTNRQGLIIPIAVIIGGRTSVGVVPLPLRAKPTTTAY